jgi:3'(2'), 5'-bisphosphate nucleotidase
VSSRTDLSDVALARQLAVAAGSLVLRLREGYGDLRDRDVARALRDEADRAAHDLIADALAQQRPDDALLSEEGIDDDRRLSASRVWIVDPLDGTWEYGQGRPDFAVHVALWHDGELVAAAVDLPARGLTHSTDSVAVVPDVLPTDRPVRLVVSRSRPPARLDDVVAGVAHRLGCAVEVVHVGSAGAKTAEVVEGRVEAYVHDAGLSEWDVAAPAAVALAAGLVVCHLDGRSLVYNAMPPLVGDLLVAVPVVAEAILDVLAD